MTKKVTLLALLLVIACAVVWAGDTKMGMAGKPMMEAMKAEMMKCTVCKHMAMHMDEIGPMGMESVKLNDGLTMSHWVKSEEPKKIAAYQAASDETGKAGEACMKMTDEQAKTDLCEFCQSIRAAMQAGAHMSMGKSKKGDIMVITSADPAVQTKLSAMQEKCAMMAAMMEPPTGGASADKQ